jgi:type IV fimbrial biogenesis protein FimT
MRNNSGFSLGELITIMGILTVLAALAIPNFIGWRSKAQLGRAAQDVYSQFQKAKIEAVRRNVKCMITFGASDFQVYVDADDSWTFNAGDQEISQVNLATYPGVSLDLTKGGGDGLDFWFPDTGIAFFPNGFAVNSLGALTDGAVFLRNKNNKEISVEITKAGNVRITH